MLDLNKASEELTELGRAAAEEVVGMGNVEQVEVVPGEDAFQHPAYHFSFLIDHARVDLRPGLILSRVIQKLRDKLQDKQDEHFPIVRILNREDWDKHTRA
jgi:hypothetical protein